MTTVKRIRWNCPNDRHPGVLGPSRPPKDSIVRYCLACSQESGRLAERIAPALERKRAAAVATSATKAKAKRAREATARERKKAAETERYTVEGVDLREEMKKLMKLRAWRTRYKGGIGKTPELVISRRSRYPSRLGYAEPWHWRITISTYPGQTLADARETLVHELTHLVVGRRPGARGWHGTEFKKMMLAAFKEAYKVGPVGIPHNVYHGRYAAALRNIPDR